MKATDNIVSELHTGESAIVQRPFKDLFPCKIPYNQVVFEWLHFTLLNPAIALHEHFCIS